MPSCNILINLKNPIDAFCLKPRHLDLLQAALPQARIEVAETRERFLEKLPEAECALVWNFRPEWYPLAPRLRTLFTPAAGNDWVASDPSGRVRTVYGRFHGRIMRESLLSMMLYFTRRVGRSLSDQQSRVWGRNGYSSCTALFSQQVLIIGCGALGCSIAELLKAFGCRVVGVRRTPQLGAVPHLDRMVAFADLEAELPAADHVVLLLPGGETTNGIITARHFSLMKQGAFLYNLGRGNCYAEADLLAALAGGPLAGAGLDVFAQEPLPPESALWQLPNLLITPHASAISQEYLDLFLQDWLRDLTTLHDITVR